MPITGHIVNADGVLEEVTLDAAEEALFLAAGAPTRAMVDRECDRRTQTMFAFEGKAYQLDERSIARITAMGADARFAVLRGADPGNLRWADPDQDFGWIATDNSVTAMDAYTMALFADAAKAWVSRNTFAAHALKAMTPVPADFNADTHWPAGA